MRPDSRRPDELRAISIEKDTMLYPEGSALITCGNTRVLCTASVEESVPKFRKGSGLGWVTAEYAMLPRSTHTRKERERKAGRIDGRGQEIQRLIGRALRSCVDLSALGERSVTIDCDVLQADGGTRTASITGGCVALALACDKLVAAGLVSRSPLRQLVSAISVGIVDGEIRADLCYLEDSAADTDMNIVGLEDGGLVEVQGTAEQGTFSPEQLVTMTALASAKLEELFALQHSVIGVPAGAA